MTIEDDMKAGARSKTIGLAVLTAILAAGIGTAFWIGKGRAPQVLRTENLYAKSGAAQKFRMCEDGEIIVIVDGQPKCAAPETDASTK